MVEELKIIVEMLNGLGAGTYSGFIVWIVFRLLKLFAILGTIIFCVKGILGVIRPLHSVVKAIEELHAGIDFKNKHRLYCGTDFRTEEITKLTGHILSQLGEKS